MNQCQQLKCKKHPETVVSSICTTQACKYPSRLACMKCVKQYNDLPAFEDFNEFHSTVQIAKALFNRVSSVPLNYLATTQINRIQLLDDLILKIQTILQNMRSELINQFKAQKEYEDLTELLKQQYDQELQKTHVLFNNVKQLDNYHYTSEWVAMEKQLNSYIKQLYQPDNPEIKKTLFKLANIKQFKDITCNTNISPNIISLIKDTFEELTFTNMNPKKASFESSLLYGRFGHQLLNRIDPKIECKLIYKGTKDGMNSKAFWNSCSGIGNTLSICQSKSGAIFGGFSPCVWNLQNKYQPDPTFKSFLYSFTRNQIYPLKKAEHAIYCHQNNGPSYGNGYDLCIGENFMDGSSDIQCYSTAGYLVTKQSTHLMGGKKPELIEIEVYSVL